MRGFGLAVAVVASMVSATANAGTVLTGSFTADSGIFGAMMIQTPNAGAFGYDFLGEHGTIDLVPGDYALSFTATADIDNLQLVEAVNQFSHLEVTGDFPGSYEFDAAILDQYVPGGADEAYRAGDVISWTLSVPADATHVDVESIGVYTTTNTYAGVVTASGQGLSDGTWTLSVTAVPEPASWALMILDFGSLGVVLRARRRGFAAAA